MSGGWALEDQGGRKRRVRLLLQVTGRVLPTGSSAVPCKLGDMANFEIDLGTGTG